MRPDGVFGCREDYTMFVAQAGDQCMACSSWTHIVWREINPGVVTILCPSCYGELPDRAEMERHEADYGGEWTSLAGLEEV